MIIKTRQELEEILNESMNQPVDLKMHLRKTKLTFNNYAKPSRDIVDVKTIEEVDSYMYLGKKIEKKKNKMSPYIRR